MPIEKIETNSIDEFWEVISPIGNLISNMENPIFRGQGDSNWALTAAALRNEVYSKYKTERDKESQVDHVIMFERSLLINFLHYLDEMGFTIPSDSPCFREKMRFDVFTGFYDKDATGWPSKEYFPFIALAQHHGIPTRLLDWTRSSFVAAYFAASQILNLADKPENLAVWIVDTSELNTLDGKLELVSLPGSTSNNMAAQKGLFLIHRQQTGMDRSSLFSSKQLENVVNQLFEESKECTAYKVTLPTNLASDLLFRCFKFGVSAATLFPNLDGAAKSAMEFMLAKKLSNKL